MRFGSLGACSGGTGATNRGKPNNTFSLVTGTPEPLIVVQFEQGGISIGGQELCIRKRLAIDADKRSECLQLRGAIGLDEIVHTSSARCCE